MSGVLDICHRVLADAQIASAPADVDGCSSILFESETVIGFILEYADVDALLGSWEGDSQRLIARYQFALRRAGEKAWNVYLVLLTPDSAKSGQRVALSAIEENLVGTRKIARGGTTTSEDVAAALLSLLPLESSPRLDPVDIKAEITLRASELSATAIQAFLSSASDATVLELLEESE